MSFRIPDNIDPNVRRVLRDIQGKIFKLEKAGWPIRKGGNQIYQTISRGQEAPGQPGELGETVGDWIHHGDLFVDGTIHGAVEAAITNIDLGVTDYSLLGTRVIGTVYQNTDDTMREVHVTVKIT